ncbi:hypothetical protein Tco_1185500, partial [Tanacetum coccineum]
GQEFDEPPTEEEALSFNRELGHSREIKYITDVIIDHLHQPWRTLASIINKFLCGKDLAYQIDNIDSKKQDKMFYPRFTKIIIHHFLEKDKSISMRNRTFMHTARDDSLLGTMRFASRHADTQVYGAIIPKAMTTQALLDSVAYKTYYAIASGAKPPKSRKSQKKSDSTISFEESPFKKKSAKAKKVADAKPKPTKKKAPVKADKGKGDGTDFESGVPDEQRRKTSGTDEGTGDSREEEDDDENDCEDENDDDGNDGDDSDRDQIPVLNQSSTEYYEEEEEKIDDEEEDDEVTKELYNDVNVNLGNKDADMTDADQGDADQQNKTDEPYKVLLLRLYKQASNLKNSSLANNEIASLMDTTVRHEELRSQTSSLYIFPVTNKLLIVTNLEKDLSEIKQVEQYAQALSSIPAIVDRYINNKLGEAIQTAMEPSHTVDDSGVQQYQEFNTGNNDEQPADKVFSKADCQVSHAKEPTTSFDELLNTPIDFSAFVLNRLNIKELTQAILVGPAFKLLKGKPYPFDLNKPLPLIRDHRGRQVIPQDFFINKDLEYLKGGDLSKRYSTFVTKIKAATYEIKLIEDLVQNVWSLVKVIYDKHTYWGTSHWGPKRQLFYGFAANMSSSREVYSRKRIIVTRLTIMKKYDYGHLEEIEVHREDQKLYKFKEDERYDLNVALRMFTKRIVIQRRVEDLQLGVKSYQKKLNLTKPDTFRSNLKNRTAYTAYLDPKRMIYKDRNNRNKLMRADELHKFSDVMLNDVRTALHDITKGIRMEYLPKSKWSGSDKRRARVMIQDIDKRLFERRLMRNLEKFVGGREYSVEN